MSIRKKGYSNKTAEVVLIKGNINSQMTIQSFGVRPVMTIKIK